MHKSSSTKSIKTLIDHIETKTSNERQKQVQDKSIKSFQKKAKPEKLEIQKKCQNDHDKKTQKKAKDKHPKSKKKSKTKKKKSETQNPKKKQKNESKKTEKNQSIESNRDKLRKNQKDLDVIDQKELKQNLLSNKKQVQKTSQLQTSDLSKHASDTSKVKQKDNSVQADFFLDDNEGISQAMEISSNYSNSFINPSITKDFNSVNPAFMHKLPTRKNTKEANHFPLNHNKFASTRETPFFVHRRPMVSYETNPVMRKNVIYPKKNIISRPYKTIKLDGQVIYHTENQNNNQRISISPVQNKNKFQKKSIRRKSIKQAKIHYSKPISKITLINDTQQKTKNLISNQAHESKNQSNTQDNSNTKINKKLLKLTQKAKKNNQDIQNNFKAINNLASEFQKFSKRFEAKSKKQRKRIKEILKRVRSQRLSQKKELDSADDFEEQNKAFYEDLAKKFKFTESIKKE